MAFPVTLNGRTYTLADFEGLNYVEGFPAALEDFVTDAGAASTSATNAASSATAAASSATAAAASATSAAASLDAIEGFYLGAAANDPTTDLNGDALTAGDWYFNTGSDALKVYNGSTFITFSALTFDLVDDTTPQLGGNLDLNGNTVGGVDATELSILDGATVSTAELNLLDGSTANTVVNSKAVVYGSGGEIAATSYTGDGSALTGIDSSPTLTATASGALANGDTIIVNSDGTVSAVSGAAEAVGSETNFSGGVSNGAHIAAVYDTNSNKVVVAYQDTYSSNQGKGVVGTVSGTSISFGSTSTFESGGASQISIVFDPDTNQVIVCYADTDDSGKGKGCLGSVSGTSISWQSPVEFESGSVANTRTACTYDTSKDAIMVVYRDSGNSNYFSANWGVVSGTTLTFYTPRVVTSEACSEFSAAYIPDNNASLVVFKNPSADGKVYRGTGIPDGTNSRWSWGPQVTFESGTVDHPRIASIGSSKAVCAWMEDNNNGVASVFSVSGGTVTIGTELKFDTTGNSGTFTDSGITYDTNAGKVVITYDNNDVGKVVALEVSGTTLLSATPFDFESNEVQYTAPVYDPDTQKVIINYQLGSGVGESRVYTTPSTNLTSENYIGISNGAYSDTATATIQLIGSVDDAQSGLTAGQSYYVLNDGSLSTTAAQPSVFAGTAVSATKIIVKG